MTSISLCMIVRDEERCLARALNSVAGVVDEICIVDTGSSDQTLSIAKEAGAKCVSRPWDGDFSAARNASLDLATGDWILVMDADEVVGSSDARDGLLEHVRAHSGSPGQVQLVDLLDNGEQRRTSLTRFFPATSEFRYAGRIHEQVTRAGLPAAGVELQVVLTHDGYQREHLDGKQKLERNGELLCEQLEEDPTDSYAWYQLGRTLQMGDRSESALEAFEQAVANISDDAPYVAHLFECAATCLRDLGRSEQALNWLGQIEADFQTRSDTQFLISLLAMDVGQLERAEAGYQRCLKLAGITPAGGPSDAATATTAPAYNLGVMHEVMGRKSDAQAAYELALSFDDQHTPSYQGLRRLAAAAS